MQNVKNDLLQSAKELLGDACQIIYMYSIHHSIITIHPILFPFDGSVSGK